MEQITKQQVILIALLVAIITAISTSVATVSLLDDPGASTQQTIYKVIERTIEKVTNIPTVKDVVSTAKQLPSGPSQLSPSDIATNGAKSVVRIYEKVGPDKKFIALGVALGSKNGVLASAPSELVSTAEYIAVTADNHEIKAALAKTGLLGGFTFFTLNYDAGEKDKAPTIDIKSSSGLKLGANVVALGGKESGNVVSTGIITEFAPLEGGVGTSTDMMVTDMILSSSLSGWLLFDTNSNLIAFETGFEAGKGARFINGGLVKAALDGLL